MPGITDELLKRVFNGIQPTADERLSLLQLNKLDLGLRNDLVGESIDLLYFPNLRELKLNGTKVRFLKNISKLTNLQKLHLRRTEVDSLEGFQNLKNLQILNLHKTKVTSLKQLGRLPDLHSIDLRYTQVYSLEELVDLSSLRRLFVDGTLIDEIPEQFARLRVRYEAEGSEDGIYAPQMEFHNNDLSCLFDEEPQTCLKEANVIFLGDAGFGKAKTIKLIVKDYNINEVEDKLVVTEYCRSNKPTIKFWNFGEKEIEYSTYRFFLTKSACYVVTVSEIESEVSVMRQARRWLKEIEKYAEKAKVIVAVNRGNGKKCWDLNKGLLKEEFPDLVDVVEYAISESTNWGIERLRQVIEDEADSLPCVNRKIPSSYSSIRDELRRQGNLVRMNWEKYQEICRSKGIKYNNDMLEVLEGFCEPGVCVIGPRAKDNPQMPQYIILNPERLNDVVLWILDNYKDSASNGIVNQSTIKPEEADPSFGIQYTRDIVLEVMRQFHLSYGTENNLEFIPSFVNKEKVQDEFFSHISRHIRCEVRYKHLPDSVVHYLMYKLPNCCDKVGVNGCNVDERETYRLYRKYRIKTDDVLYIDIYRIDEDGKSDDLRAELDALFRFFNKVNKEIEPKPTIWIYANDENNAAFLLESLLNAKVNVVTYLDNGKYAAYTTDRILGGRSDDLLWEEKKAMNGKEYAGNKAGESTSRSGDTHNYYGPYNDYSKKDSHDTTLNDSQNGSDSKNYAGIHYSKFEKELLPSTDQLMQLYAEINKSRSVEESLKKECCGAISKIVDEPKETRLPKWKEFCKKYGQIILNAVGGVASLITIVQRIQQCM